MPRRHNSLRLRGYDYSQQGAYFVTVMTKNREMLFGDVIDGKMVVNDFGKIVHEVWNDLENHYSHVVLDEFVVMPSHVHGIVVINNNVDVHVGAGYVGVGLRPTPTKGNNQSGKINHSLSEIIRAFKSFSSRRINEIRNTPGVPVWQRGFHDRIIRNEPELKAIREYIQTNPQRWLEDSERPS